MKKIIVQICNEDEIEEQIVSSTQEESNQKQESDVMECFSIQQLERMLFALNPTLTLVTELEEDLTYSAYFEGVDNSLVYGLTEEGAKINALRNMILLLAEDK